MEADMEVEALNIEETQLPTILAELLAEALGLRNNDSNCW